MSLRSRVGLAGRDGDEATEVVEGEPAAAAPPSGEAGPRTARLGRELRLDLLVGALVLVVYLIVQLWFLLGPRPLDNAKYFDTAVDFPDVPVDLWTLRIGLIVLVKAAVLAFGPSEAALYAVPIAAGLLLAAAVYGTMLVLFRDRVLAAAAALVTVLSNVFLFTSSFIYPDTTATATLTAGFFFLVLAGVRTEGGDRGWVPTAAVAAAGVLFGASYLIREFSPFLLPAVIVAVVVFRFPWRRIGLLAGTAVATASLELLYGLVRYGEPFIHIQELLGRNHSSFAPKRGERMEYIQSQLDNLFDTILVGPRLILAWRTGWLFLLVVVVLVVALALVRDRRFWLLAAWCLSFWAIMVVIGLGELPSGRWIVNITNVRYWYPILPALVMASFGGLWLLAQRWLPGGRGVRVAQVTAAGLTALILLPGFAEFRSCAAKDPWGNDPAERWQGLKSWLATPEADAYDVLWTDYQSHRLVPAYSATTFGRRLWNGDVEKLPLGQPLPLTGDLDTTLLLIHKPRLRALSPDLLERLETLRSDWSPVYVSSDGEMVLLAHESSPNQAGAAAGGEWWDPEPGTRTAAPGVCGRSPYER